MMPWSNFWDRNLFVVALPGLQRLLSSSYTRGAVSGVGFVTAIAGVVELAAAFGAWHSARSDEPKVGA